ncbi:PKD domain-containing protein [Spongiibacter sp. KMU-166]|uniref:PKD domain-containing protein n=1 Tax=Spongiibacter thalassae TaxID=2721624 RepID=A0ABX1GGI9_9GAMM|nr:PKD domain-containing protein [Spongiibacter thalassae]NKI18310.1 PKD domain-containing protein [Spongiibacter thalassae]
MRARQSTKLQYIALFLLLSACGGTSSPPPTQETTASAQLSIVGENQVAPGVEHRLYAVTNTEPAPQGPWRWQVAAGESLLTSSISEGDTFSFVATDVETVREIVVAVQVDDGDGELLANKTIQLYPSDDDTQRPQVFAGDDSEADEGTLLTLSGRAEARGGRSVRRMQWQQSRGPTADIIGGSDQDLLRLSLPQVNQPETLAFRLQATDSGGFTGEDEVQIHLLDTLPNRLPSANAGADRAAFGREHIILSGLASDDDGEIVAVQWIALPPFEHLAIADADTLEPSFIAPNVASSEVLRIRLRVTDNDGGVAEDEIALTVHPGSNWPPEIVHVNVEPGVVYSGETAFVSAQTRDADGDALQLHWQVTSDDGAPEISVQPADKSEAGFIVPPLDKPYTIDVVLRVSDGRETVHRARQVQILPRQQAEPDFLSCVQSPLQPNCPLYPVAGLLDPASFSACADPLDEACIFADLMGPALRQCLTDNEPDHCRDGLKQLHDPSYVLEQLGSDAPADACNPAYDEQSFEHYIGALHEHTGYSDGVPLTRPADAYREIAAKGYDFAASSDHSDTLQIPLSVGLGRAECPPEQFLYCVFLVDDARPQDALVKWAATLDQSVAASSASFTAIRGFEWTSDRFGHINVYFSRNFINAKTGPGYAVSMANFWQWFSYPAAFGGGSDGLLSFNHPGREDAVEGVLENLGGDPAYTFNDFRFVPAADYRTVGIEVFGKGSEYDSDGPGGSWLSYALDKGWHLAPISSEDHHGLAWGDPDLPKTVLISRSRSLDDLREAMLARRAYAVAQNYVDVRGVFNVGGMPMGSRLRAPVGSVVPVSMEVTRDGRPMHSALIQLVGPGNTVVAEFSGGWAQTEMIVPNDKTYLFLRVLDTAANRRPVMFSAPVWLLPGSAPLPTCLPPEVWRGESALYPSLP